MRAYFLTAPVWVQSVFLGVTFGVVFGAFTVLVPLGDGRSWVTSLVVGGISGVFFGFFMGQFVKQDRGATRSELKNLSCEQRRVALRSAARGPAPGDPDIRQAALRCAEHNWALREQRSRSKITVFTVLLGGYAVMAVTISPWWWLAFVMFVGFLADQLTSGRRLQHRIAVLSDSTGTAP